MKVKSQFLVKFRNAALLATLCSAPALATTISTCEIVPSGSGGSNAACPTSSTLPVSNGGGASLTYTSANPTIPFNTSTELGFFQVTGNSANSGVASPATFNFWVNLGTTTLPYFSGSIASNGAITFSGNSSTDSTGTYWTASSANGYAILTSATGEEVEISNSSVLDISKQAAETNINGEVILPAAATPEPATFGFMALGGLTMVGIARRRRAAR
jgi:hypothetical protein